MEIVPARDLWSVRADPAQLGQVIVNLASNARDAIAGGGHLTLETANVQLDTTYSIVHASCPPGRYVMLAVTDSGSGMDADTLPIPSRMAQPRPGYPMAQRPF